MTKNEVGIAIRRDAGEGDAPLSVAEPLPDVCAQHGNPVHKRQGVRVKFATREIGFRQITYLRSILDGKSALRVFKYPKADVEVTGQWPRCPLCLARTIFFRALGSILVVAAVVPVALFFAKVASAVLFDQMPDFADNIVKAAPYALVYGLAFTRGAFSYARPVLRARLGDERTALVVTAHPAFIAALDDLRRHPRPVSAPSIW